VALLLVAEGVAVGHVGRHPTPGPPEHVGRPVTAPPTTSPDLHSEVRSGRAATVLGVDQAVISGTVTSAHLVGARAVPLTLPVTITIPNRGQGELDIDGVVVDGHPGASVAWDGGQPLPLAGTGALELGAATMDANSGGVTWHLDGSPRLLRPGQYVAESAVAVGTAGLAQPLDQARFSVPAGTQPDLVSVGDAQIHLAPVTESLTGPGSVELLGALTVRTSAGTRLAHNLHFGPGPFTLTLRPSRGGYAVTGLLQGPLDVLS
jgi:hypothetical protein